MDSSSTPRKVARSVSGAALTLAIVACAAVAGAQVGVAGGGVGDFEAHGDVGAPRGNLRIQIIVKKHPMLERRRNDEDRRRALSHRARSLP